MTTTPKAKKFRIRRTGPQPGEALRRVAPDSAAPEHRAAPEQRAMPEQQAAPERRPAPKPETAAPSQPPEQPPRKRAPKPLPPLGDNPFGGVMDDGFGDIPFPTAAANAAISEPDEVATEQVIAEIRKEGLTGRQLRMARRVAQKHGLAPTSDFDAIRLLRKEGIDPFKHSSMLELVVPGEKKAPVEKGLGVPQTVPKPQLPSTEVMTEDKRAKEIIRMQRDIVKRRRRKLAQLAARLTFFVMLPTILVGYYFYTIATPLYATKSEFVIQQAQPSMGGSAGGLASMFSGTSLATSQDSITVQGYLQSVEAMLRLEKDVGFISHFSQPDIDPLQRLETGASKEEAHKVFRKNVKISYDPTEGIIKMEVIAADPESSQMFSERLIGYAEEQVDNLTQRLRADQMQGALESFEEAEQKMLGAQMRVLELQERLGVLDPVTESTALMGQVSTFETQLAEKRLQLQQLLDNQRPNRARVDGTEGDIRRLEALIASLRSQLTESGTGNASLARVTGELRIAETDLQTRQLLMTQALQQMETARIEANRQTRYLSTGVRPIAPDDATYPRAFENTILAFLIFGGVYLMFSLTASILREQVSG